MMPIRYLILAAALLCLAACKKTDNPMSDQDKQDLLINKKWIITEEYLRDSTGKVGQDYWPQENAALKDDYYLWEGSTLKYYFNDRGTLTPGQTTSANDTGTWILNNSQITMTSYQPNRTNAILKITAISSDKLNVEFPRNSKEFIQLTLKPVQ